MSYFVATDKMRVDQFALIGTGRLFPNHIMWTDPEGVVWAVQRHGVLGFGVTWLGANWVFDRIARERAARRLAERQAAMVSSGSGRHAIELRQLLGRLRFGHNCERLLWAIHSHVMRSKSSVLRLPDYTLATYVWGSERWPRHWRKDLMHLLDSLCWLHVFEWVGDNPPPLGPTTALITYAADLRGIADDKCGADCPGYGNPRHHHYLLNIARGFLGILEQFGQDNGDGSRAYNFPIGNSRSKGPTLWQAGKTGRLGSVFLPAFLGAPAAPAVTTHRQRRLLQTLVVETTRAKKSRPGDKSEAAVIFGGIVPGFDGRKTVKCQLLADDSRYVGFNGNGRRSGCGYRLQTDGGWLAKMGYDLADVNAFLADLAAIAGPLGLTAIGVDRDPRFVDLSTMRGLASSAIGRRELGRLHFRIYTEADYVDRWTRLFQADDNTPKVDARSTIEPSLADLLAALKANGISRRALAAGIRMDASFVTKVLNGAKAPPKGLVEKALGWIAQQHDERAVGVRPRPVGPTAAGP